MEMDLDLNLNYVNHTYSDYYRRLVTLYNIGLETLQVKHFIDVNLNIADIIDCIRK